MFPLAYNRVFQSPAEYSPPDDSELLHDTEYPNLNSSDYARRPINRQQRMHPTWEFLTLNEEQHAVIGINKLSGREWTGSLWGFEKLDDISPAASCFRLTCNALITQMEYMSKNMLIVALNTGALQLWSTYSEMRNKTNPYCLFMIGEKCEHGTPITAMNVIRASPLKAITGSKDGTLKIWDTGSADLCSTNNYRFAHTDTIMGLDTAHNEENIFATCSLDKSALVWDIRQTLPAIAAFENHKVRFRSVAWADPSIDTGNSIVHLADEIGELHTVDIRSPNKFQKSTIVLDRAIRKIYPNGKYLAIIGDTNTIKVCDVLENDAIIYENSLSKNFVRDAAWRSANELLTVGYEGKLRFHVIN